MNTKKLIKKIHIYLILLLPIILSSCERHEYCAECWENKPLITFGGPGDVSFCSDDAYLVDEFIFDYESFGWDCKFRD